MNTMFGLHTAIALEIVAGVAAAFLILVAANRVGAIRNFGIWAGGLGLLFSVFGMACTAYYGIAYWNEGVYNPKAVAESQNSQTTMCAMMGAMHQGMQGMMGTGPKSDEHHPQ